jgi:hypothetical protein
MISDRTDTMEEINSVSVERAELYRQATNGHRGDAAVLARIKQLDVRLSSLWERRRRERAGRRDGIDRMIERSYQITYGLNFEERPTLA